MYPPIRFTRHGLRLRLEQGSGKQGHRYVELHVEVWDPDTGWGWVGAQLTDSAPSMLVTHRDHLRMLLRYKWTPLSKLKTQESIEQSLTHLSHTFPSTLPPMSYWAKGVT